MRSVGQYWSLHESGVPCHGVSGQNPGTQNESTPMSMKQIAAAALAFTLTLSATTVVPAQCPSDVIPSGNVDGVDLSAVLGAWGSDGSGAYSTDVNGDGVVGGADLTALIASWGPCVPRVPAWATLLETAPNPNVVTSASQTGMRLPTEAEWEYAYRAPAQRVGHRSLHEPTPVRLPRRDKSRHGIAIDPKVKKILRAVCGLPDPRHYL